jgi:hypothetical protein
LEIVIIALGEAIIPSDLPHNYSFSTPKSLGFQITLDGGEMRR